MKWLRVKHEDSIKLSLEIPINFSNNAKGAKHILIDSQRLPYFLDLRKSDVIGLNRSGLIQDTLAQSVSRKRIDYHNLALNYQHVLETGAFETKSALARNLGVSRAWISKVINRSTLA